MQYWCAAPVRVAAGATLGERLEATSREAGPQRFDCKLSIAQFSQTSRQAIQPPLTLESVRFYLPSPVEDSAKHVRRRKWVGALRSLYGDPRWGAFLKKMGPDE